MLNPRASFVIALLTLAPFSAFAEGPGVSSGGDSIVGNSPLKEVVWMLSRSNTLLDPHALDANVFTAMLKDQSQVKDVEIKAVLKAFLKGARTDAWGQYVGGSALENDINASPVQIERKRPCYSHGGEEVDASVEAFRPGSKICMSAQRLTRIPRQALRSQVEALLLHEIAHHFGFGESAAVKIQKYFLDEVLTGRADLRMRLTWNFVKESKETIADLRSGQKSEGGAGPGFRLGMLGSFFELTATKITGLDTINFTDKPAGYYKGLAEKEVMPVAAQVQDIGTRLLQDAITSSAAANELEALIPRLMKLQARIGDLVESRY